MMTYSAIALAVGYIADILFGDPKWLYHPVRIIGNSIALCEKFTRRIFPDTPAGQITAGVMLVLIICIGSAAVPAAILYLCFKAGTTVGIIAESFMCYQMLAVKSLKQESMKVYDALENGSVSDGRKAVSMIVGRDTESLDKKGITKATVETVAENFSDGVFAPMLYMIIGGPVLMFLYKGINTMDSMIAYKNDRYLYFGRCAAKLDDIANYIPARLAALTLVVASGLRGIRDKNSSMKGSWKVFKRDRYNHASPNSAQTESAVAGALGIQLAGDAYYFGKLYKKKTIGDDIRDIENEDIKRVNGLMYIASSLTVAVFVIVHTVLCVVV